MIPGMVQLISQQVINTSLSLSYINLGEQQNLQLTDFYLLQTLRAAAGTGRAANTPCEATSRDTPGPLPRVRYV